ncbi:MAG: M16 family metallopeptidase [Prochlorotrichaceae cyanobacterium]|jgi:predicted Zn-dependent peptidase
MNPSVLPDPTRLILKNNITLVVTPNPTVDVISARFLLRAGSLLESAAQMGLVNLLAAVLTKGTQQRSSLDIAETVEYCGGSLSTDSGNDFFALSFKSMSGDFAKLLHLSAELLREPSFPEAEVDLERNLILQGIRAKQEYPFTLAFDQLKAHLYGDHPYGFANAGTIETVSALQREDLQTFHHRYFRPDNLVISIAGRIEVESCLAQVEQTLGDWAVPAKSLEFPTYKIVDQSIVTTPQHLYLAKETHQSIVILGYLTTAVHDPSYAPLKLLSSYLGNGMSSRLFTELREKQGLAYEVSALYPTRLDPALFVVYIGTSPQNQALAGEGLQREVDRLREEPLSEADLHTAKSKLLGQYALGKQTTGQLAQLFGWYEILGLGIEFDQIFPDKIKAISASDLQKIATQYLHTPCSSIVGPEIALFPTP